MIDWRDLTKRTGAELSKLDIAVANSACAAGLPGTQRIDFAANRARLDEWAELVHQTTRRSFRHFERHPERFNHSEANFRVNAPITVLQRDLGIRYNPALIEHDDFFANPANVFLYGAMRTSSGTCSSLPPLLIAVGRRLGYPLKLAAAKSHLYARWDDPLRRQEFNIECTSLGFNSYPDRHYLKWPIRTTADEARRYGLLRSKTPREELAAFVAMRGHCWLDDHHYAEAVEAYAWAAEVDPLNHLHAGSHLAALTRWEKRLRAHLETHPATQPITFSATDFTTIPHDILDKSAALQSAERNHCASEMSPAGQEPTPPSAGAPSPNPVTPPAQRHYSYRACDREVYTPPNPKEDTSCTTRPLDAG